MDGQTDEPPEYIKYTGPNGGDMNIHKQTKKPGL